MEGREINDEKRISTIFALLFRRRLIRRRRLYAVDFEEMRSSLVVCVGSHSRGRVSTLFRPSMEGGCVL